MTLIRTREGTGGTKYQVIIRRSDRTTLSRTFRRLADAKTWAHREEQKGKADVPTVTGRDP